jgi:N-acetylglucosamine-6-phosphate deacetylase
MTIAYKSSRILSEAGMKNGYLIVDGAKITSFATEIENMDVVDCGNDRILPGIFDTHNHGAFGYSLMGVGDPDEARRNIKGYLKGIASQGVTSILPTADIHLFQAIAQVAQEKDVAGAKILGIHSEGPWLNRVGEKGIKTGFPLVDMEVAKKMVKDTDGLLKLVALAPEIPGIDTVKDYFLSQGIAIAFAHSDANYMEAKQAFEHGITVSTHTGNVMTGLHHRDIGGLGAALTCPDVMCEIICDGRHVSLEMLDLYFRIKNYDKFMMVSDCTPLSGAPLGRYHLFGDMNVTITPEGFCLSDTGRLMGSTMPVIYGMKNLVEINHVPLEIVSQMASLNPMKKYGFAASKGSLVEGKDADFIIIDDAYTIIKTIVEGKVVYDASVDNDLFNPEFLRIARLDGCENC